jgi:hypothetical protein
MEISEAKLKANKQNGLKGGEVLKRRADENYAKNPSYCTECKVMLPRQKKNNKFCSQSCAATHNNRGVQRHGRLPHKCKGCDTILKGSKIWCSNACQGRANRKYKTEEERLDARRKSQREVFARYYSKKKYQTPHDADLTAIKEFYANCPQGYEVDHIIPISKGGAHSIDNLQYLTISENRSKGNKILN